MPILAGSFNLLSVNPGLLIWTVVTFLTVLFLLWLFAWKPILNALDSRNDKVEKDIQESQRLREEAEKLLKEYEEKMKASQRESAELTAASQREAENAKNKLLKKAEEECNDLKERAKKEIEQAKESAVNEIQSSIVDTTISVLSKILKKDVEDETHKRLILDEIKNFQGTSDVRH